MGRLGLGLAIRLQLGIGIGFRCNHSWSSIFTPRRNHSLCPFWWIPDAFWRTNFEAVVCSAQDVHSMARLYDRFCHFFSDRLQFMRIGLD